VGYLARSVSENSRIVVATVLAKWLREFACDAKHRGNKSVRRGVIAGFSEMKVRFAVRESQAILCV
jgi:hypothetical protein